MSFFDVLRKLFNSDNTPVFIQDKIVVPPRQQPEPQFMADCKEIPPQTEYEAYFKNGIFGELSKEQQSRNYEKSIMWLNKGIVPKWLLKDMMKYGYKPVIIYNSTKALTY